MFKTSGTYPWSLVTQIFHSGQPSHGGDHKSDDFNLTKKSSERGLHFLANQITSEQMFKSSVFYPFYSFCSKGWPPFSVFLLL